MQCKYALCSNETKGSGAYCSNSCRAQQSRRNRISATSEAQQVSIRDVPVEFTSPMDDVPMLKLKSLSRSQLMSKIHAYPADQWVGSAEHKELLRRLKAWSIEKLESLGYFIPAWRASA